MNRLESAITSFFAFNPNCPKLETFIVKMSDKFRWPIFIILGFILSLWSNVLLVACFYGGLRESGDLLLMIEGFITHVLFSIFAIGWLITGLKQRDPDLLKPWMVLKGIELIGLITVVILANIYDRYRLVPAAVFFIIIGVYLLTCIYGTWRQMKKDLISNPTLNIPTSDSEKPPSYESFTNQSNKV